MKRILAVALLAFLTACAGMVTPTKPSQIVYAAHGDYAAALPVAIQYKRLPTCGPAVSKLCKDPAVLKKLQAADDEAFKTLSAAQAAVRLGDGTGGSAEATAAQKAIAEFKKQTALLPKVTP